MCLKILGVYPVTEKFAGTMCDLDPLGDIFFEFIGDTRDSRPDAVADEFGYDLSHPLYNSTAL